MTEILLTAYDGAILGPIAKLLGLLMNGVYSLMALVGIENVGLSIILFTIVIYACMFPLTYKQQKFSKLSQKMQPELNAVNKKYQGKKDEASMLAMREETQAVYDKYGVSMMGSCVQMLIQFPLLLALYRVFINVPAYVTGVKENFTALVEGIMSTSGYTDKMAGLVDSLNIYTSPSADFTVTEESRLSNFIVDVLYKMNSAGWDTLKDTFPSLSSVISSTYERVSHVNNFLGLNISDTPLQIIRSSFSNHSYLMMFVAILIPAFAYLTQILSIKMMPQSSSNSSDGNDSMAKQMSMMNKVMPLFSLVMCFSVPVGLGIYWSAGPVVRIVQQYFLNRHFENLDLDDIIKKNQEKAKKKRKKMGLAENQISNAAKIKTKQIAQPQAQGTSSADKEKQLERANAAKMNAKKGSLSSKADMVREFNERNNKK